MAGWKDRAIAVDDTPKSGSWKDRAVPVTDKPVVKPPDDVPYSETIKESGLNALGMGLAPFSRGVGAGAYEGLEALKQGKGVGESFDAAKKGFLEARDVKNKEIQRAEQANPKTAIASGLLGAVPGMFLAGGGLRGAAAAGAAAGAGQGLSEAESPKEALTDIAKGGAIGAGTYGVAKGVQAAMPAVKKGLGVVGTKLGSAVSGIPEQDISTYAAKTDEVKNLISAHGGDVADMADSTKQKITDAISSTKKQLGDQIGEELSKLGPQKTLSVQPLLDSLDPMKGRLADKVRADPEILNEFEKLQSYVKNIAGGSDKISPSEMHSLKEILQEKAKGAYLKNGQMFSMGSDAQKAAKAAAFQARAAIEAVAPGVGAANQQLSELHDIEGVLNKNILKQGGSSAALSAAGSGANPEQQKLLQRLGQATNSNPVEEAQKFSAARQFGNPSILPTDTTGKSVSRQNLATTLGGAAGAGIGGVLGGPTGAVAGSAVGGGLGRLAASPMAIKAMIKAGQIPAAIFNRFPSQVSLTNYLISPQGQLELQHTMKLMKGR